MVFGAIVGAVYLRLGVEDSYVELMMRQGFLKGALATVFCLAAFYLFDLYDFVVMHDRRELVLRLIQALGLAWVALALAFYAFPLLMLGRGISLIALPLALGLMVGWRISIHWLLVTRFWQNSIISSGRGGLVRAGYSATDASYRLAGFIKRSLGVS